MPHTPEEMLKHSVVLYLGAHQGGFTELEKIQLVVDFKGFIDYVIAHDLRGIRHAFVGCIHCGQKGPADFQRLLFIDPEVLAVTENRALFAERCRGCHDVPHAALVQDAVRQAQEPVMSQSISGGSE